MVQYWRAAGMTYLRYSNKCTELLRKALKEPARSKALGQVDFEVTRAQWVEGKVAERNVIGSKG